jgi:hypothetical protein
VSYWKNATGEYETDVRTAGRRVHLLLNTRPSGAAGTA